MTKKTTEKVLNFVKIYRLSPQKERIRIRDEFMKSSGIAQTSWYGRILRASFSPLEMKELERICGREL